MPLIESIPDAVVRHAVLVMMQLASIASNLNQVARGVLRARDAEEVMQPVT